MDIVILDLEWNAAYSRRIKGYINEIIQFGAVKVSPGLQEKSCFSCFVKPQVSKHVNALSPTSPASPTTTSPAASPLCRR